MKAPEGEEQRLFIGTAAARSGPPPGLEMDTWGQTGKWQHCPLELSSRACDGDCGLGRQAICLWFRGQHVWIFLGSGDIY